LDTSYLSLDGKVALITGATRGIGKAIAVMFADAGADLAVSSRKQPDLEVLADEIRTAGRKVLPVAAHCREQKDLENLFEKAKKEYGRIDILVNNAATSPRMGNLTDMSLDIYDQIMNTNLRGCFLLCQMAAKMMMAQGGGTIINISSLGGIKPGAGLGLYGISKAGVNMLTKVLAAELGKHGIRVNAIAPGIVRTGFSKPLWSNEELYRRETKKIPLGRIAETEEVARTALYLASDASSFVTGQIIVLDGGWSL